MPSLKVDFIFKMSFEAVMGAIENGFITEIFYSDEEVGKVRIEAYKFREVILTIRNLGVLAESQRKSLGLNENSTKAAIRAAIALRMIEGSPKNFGDNAEYIQEEIR